MIPVVVIVIVVIIALVLWWWLGRRSAGPGATYLPPLPQARAEPPRPPAQAAPVTTAAPIPPKSEPAMTAEPSLPKAALATPPVKATPAPSVEAAPPAPTPAPKPPAAASRPDDLTVIEGIGPKISGMLRAEGITSYAHLAATDVSRLREIMLAANLRIADPTTWPEQAALAAAAKWEDLKTLQGTLKAGRRA